MFEFDLNTLICLKMLHSHSKYIFWLYVVIVPSIQNIKYSVIHTYAAAAAKSFQLCPTLCDPVGGSPPGFPVLGILQARILEWVTISFSSAWKWNRLVVPDSLWPHGLQHTRLLRPWNSPGKSTGVGCHCLLQLIHNFISAKIQTQFLVSML